MPNVSTAGNPTAGTIPIDAAAAKYRGPFALIPHWLTEKYGYVLRPFGLAVYAYLLGKAGGRGECEATRAEISGVLGIGVTTVQGALKVLRKADLAHEKTNDRRDIERDGRVITWILPRLGRQPPLALQELMNSTPKKNRGQKNKGQGRQANTCEPSGGYQEAARQPSASRLANSSKPPGGLLAMPFIGGENNKENPEENTERRRSENADAGDGPAPAFDETPEGLAQAWCFFLLSPRRGSRGMAKRDEPDDVLADLRELIRLGHQPKDICAAIVGDRDRTEYFWEFKKRLTERRQPHADQRTNGRYDQLRDGGKAL